MNTPSHRALLLLMSFNVILTETAARNVSFECPTAWDLIGTHCYNFINITMDFEDARSVCHEYGAALLVVRDEVEAKNVSSIATTKFAGDHYWIYNGRDGQMDKNSLNNTFCQGMWQPDEPRETNEDVAVASNMQGTWAVTWVWKNLPFVCRMPACPAGSFRCSEGSCLNERWKCDDVFDCKDHSDESDCSDSIKYYRQSSGSIDTTNMSNRDYYQWIIEGQPGEVLRVEFETVTIEDHVDSVRVYSGGSSIITSELIQEIRSSLPAKITVFGKNHFLIITVHSDATVFKPNIKASWRPDNEASWQQVETVSVTDTPSLITSPYINSSLAPESFKREWLLTAPEGELITLEVHENTFEQNPGSDRYIITNVGFVLKELNSNKAVYISSKNSMSVIIKTHAEKRTFSAHFRKGCDFTTELTLATFSVMNLPGNLNCSWKMTNALGTDFRLRIDKAHFDDYRDSLQVYNGTDMNVGMIIDTVNNNNVGPKEFSSLSYGVSFKYFSDIVQPGIEVQGRISADCPKIVDSNMNVTHSKVSGSGKAYNAHITCNKGFTFKQEEYSKNQTLQAVCYEGGKWDWGSPSYTRAPECQVVYCGFPPSIPNGHITSTTGSISYSSVLNYQCFSGFQITLPSITCLADGRWSAIPSCSSNTSKCSAIPPVVNGNSTTLGDWSQGTIINFSCDPGYDLQGPQQIVCLSSKTWSHDPPVCRELTCSLPVVKHGNYITTSKPLPKYGELLILFCDPGYHINRTMAQNDSSVTCSVNRKLSIEDDYCVDIDECSNGSLNNCSTTEDCKNKEGSYFCVCKSGYDGTDCKDVDECALRPCHQNCTNLNGSYYCTCQEGYILYTKNGTSGFYIPAREDGLKSNDVFQINNTCVPIICENGPEVPTNGHSLTVKSHYFYNDTVDILCDFGYKLEGSTFATCQSSGNWTYTKPPLCKNLTCPQPAEGKHESARVPASGDIEPLGSLIITCNLNDGTGNITNRTMFCAPSPDDFGSFSLQGDDPKCPEVDCGNPLDIPGAMHNSVTNTTYGSSFEFACDVNRGFRLVGVSSQGNRTVICQNNGRWGFANLTCEGIRCKDPGTMGGTNQIVRTSYEIDQIVQYNCTRPGFTPVPNDTLVCEYKNGNATWSGHPPICEDTERPVITCPSDTLFDLYSQLVYPRPNVTDNSGFSCLILESGPPSGVSVVSKNLTVKYKATDSRNDVFCEFNITVKDYSAPEIKCPAAYQKDLGGNSSEMFNLTEAVLTSQSGDGTITFNPVGPINLTVGSVVPVRARITKSNGLFKECAFLVSAVSTTCLNSSLTPPEHGRIEQCVGDGSSMTCTAVCDDGYLLQNSTSYSCINGTWALKLPLQPCLKLSDTTFDFDVTLQYMMSGHKLPLSPQYNSTLCLGSQYSKITQLVQNMSACGYDNFKATKVNKTQEINSTTDEISFTLHLYDSDGNETAVLECATEILNQAEKLFGPTDPKINNMSCFSPWIVVPTHIVMPNNFSCGTNSTLLNENGQKYCLPCGPGMFFNNTSCQECANGYYQDGEGKTTCKPCPSGVLMSHMPRTTIGHCFEYCPAGFESASSYKEYNCTACPENYYSSNLSKSCFQCPKNGSTLGVSGADSETQCSEPCPPGQYSLTGYLPCSPCPQHFYSDTFGAHICEECPNGTYTNENGSASQGDCQSGNTLCTANFCNTEGTMRNTTCKIVDHRPLCICNPSFFGDSCNERCNVCKSNPCHNNGTCTATDGFNFVCTCKNDTTCRFESNQRLQYAPTSPDVSYSTNRKKEQCQEMCDKNISCKAYLVEANTICYLYDKLLLENFDNIHKSFVKNCSPRQLFDGPLCEHDMVNDCSDTVCTNLDFCMDLVGSTKCQCPQDGNYDSKCAKPDDQCQGVNSSHHGKCVPYGSVRSVCECEPGYTGDNCEIDINECSVNSYGCLYNGTCQDGSNMYSCSCINGFSGSHCEVLEDLCSNNDCKISERGFCNMDFQNLAAKCTCGEHYMLDPQKLDVCVPRNYCMSSPCVSGTCRNILGGFSCDCNSGYEGSHCQYNIDDCVSHMCQNGAFCNDEVNSYSCICPSGFSGVHCEDDIDDCTGSCAQENLQQNCIDMVADFYCPCKPEFTGKNCSEDVDECTVLEPCLHGGNCTNVYGGYNCTCPPGWTGHNCEQDQNYCSSNTCKNKGLCHNLLDTFYCQCQTGTSGTNCDVAEDMCKKFNDTVCTVNGKCELDGGTAKCQCSGDYSGSACELQKDHCAYNPCNGGICTLSNLTYVCNCSNVKNVLGDTCDKPVMTCEKCPKSLDCKKFQDQDGYLNYACMCPANATLVGDTCQTLDTNYDLVFLESFADKKTFVTSERGFYLEKNSSLSVTMWVAAAGKLNDSNFLLGLRSSRMRDHFLLIFNTEIQIRTNQSYFKNISFDFVTSNSLDESYNWHFISVAWSANGSLTIVFDFYDLPSVIMAAGPPSDEFVFVDLGQSFHGYISQVSVWKSVLTTADSYDIYRNKLAVPQMSNLLLGWTAYSYDSSIQKITNSTAAESVSICSIPYTIANMGLNIPECKNNSFIDKTPPKFNFCNESIVIPTDYTMHQVNSSVLGNKYTDNPDDTPQSPEIQFFSFGAYDIAVTAADVEGNIGVCMTRGYITPNKCTDTEPASYLTKCSGDSNGKVTCPAGTVPSVPAPNFIACGKLQTYNLDNMYEKPNRIVCGVRQQRPTTVKMLLSYTIQVDCKKPFLSDFSTAIKSQLMNLSNTWPGLCQQNCSNVVISANCTNATEVNVHIQISSLSEYLNSSAQLVLNPLELMKLSIAQFDVIRIGGAVLSDSAQIDAAPYCDSGYGLSGMYCVHCGRGSYYLEGEMKCQLCELNKYSDQDGSTTCKDCPSNNVTFQRGSSSASDCKDKCPPGQMLNGTTDKCVPCPKNFYQDQEGKSYCFPCPPLAGTENNGSNSINDCIAFCKAGTELKGQKCLECQRGFYRPGYLQDPCTKCPSSNYTTRGNGSISESQCNILSCPPGSYLSGKSQCVSCPTGQYQNESEQTSCKSCGMVSGFNASTFFPATKQEADCFPECPEGLYVNISTRSCVACPLGYYKDVKNLDTVCKPCNNGFTNAKEGETSSASCVLAKCGRGYYRENVNSTGCKQCPVGEYRSSDISPDVLPCTPCPVGTTTLIAGVPAKDGYCIKNCSEGEEYHLTTKNCSACPLGMYRPEGIREPPTCLYCPAGYTTLHTGESRCTNNSATVVPNVKVDLKVDATITVQDCSNPDDIDVAIKSIVLQLIQNQNNRYNGLCTGDCTSDVNIKIDNLCGHSSRKKRQMDSKAIAHVMVNNIDAVLTKNSDNISRSSMAVLLEAFYDQIPVEKKLAENRLIIDSIKALECGQQCVVGKLDYPQFCLSGQFIGVDECEACPKGSYSTEPASKICINCPDGQTTLNDSSLSINSCDGICATNTSYCGSKGACKTSAAGKHYCECDSDYTGPACSQRETSDENTKLVIGISVGVGGLLLILLVIIGCYAWRKRGSKESSHTDLRSESEFADNILPAFYSGMIWSDPTMYPRGVVELKGGTPSVYFTSKDLAERREQSFEQRRHSHYGNSSDDWD